MTSIAYSPTSIQTSERSAIAPTLVWGSSSPCWTPAQAGSPRRHHAASSLCPPPLRTLRSPRLCGGAVGLRDQRRTQPGNLLSSSAALGGAAHGAVRPRETALPLGALTLSGERQL